MIQEEELAIWWISELKKAENETSMKYYYLITFVLLLFVGVHHSQAQNSDCFNRIKVFLKPINVVGVENPEFVKSIRRDIRNFLISQQQIRNYILVDSAEAATALTVEYILKNLGYRDQQTLTHWELEDIYGEDREISYSYIQSTPEESWKAGKDMFDHSTQFEFMKFLQSYEDLLLTLFPDYKLEINQVDTCTKIIVVSEFGFETEENPQLKQQVYCFRELYLKSLKYYVEARKMCIKVYLSENAPKDKSNSSLILGGEMSKQNRKYILKVESSEKSTVYFGHEVFIGEKVFESGNLRPFIYEHIDRLAFKTLVEFDETNAK